MLAQIEFQYLGLKLPYWWQTCGAGKPQRRKIMNNGYNYEKYTSSFYFGIKLYASIIIEYRNINSR